MHDDDGNTGNGNRTTDTEVRPRRSLEELVDRLMDALFTAGTARRRRRASATRSIHEARRLRQAGDFDTALAVLGSVDTWRRPRRGKPGGPSPSGSRWSGGGSETGGRWSTAREPGRASALVPHGDGGMLEVAAVLGMRWRPGKVVSERSLRGLRPLSGGA